jgi:hypothetical protein
LKLLEAKLQQNVNRKTNNKNYELMKKINCGDMDSTFLFDDRGSISRDGGDSFTHIQRKVDEEFQ